MRSWNAAVLERTECAGQRRILHWSGDPAGRIITSGTIIDRYRAAVVVHGLQAIVTITYPVLARWRPSTIDGADISRSAVGRAAMYAVRHT